MYILPGSPFFSDRGVTDLSPRHSINEPAEPEPERGREQGRSGEGSPGVGGGRGSAGELEIEKRWVLRAQIDPQEFIHLYEKYYEPIGRFLGNKVHNKHDAEDLISRTFTRALNNRKKFQWQGVTFGAWLFRIAINEFRRERRRQSYWKNDDSVEIEQRPGADPSPLGDLIRAEEKELIRRCVWRLEGKIQDVIILRFWQNLRIKQIAAIMKMPEGTVKVYLKRGRDRIARMLDEEGPEAGPGGDDGGPDLRVVPGR